MIKEALKALLTFLILFSPLIKIGAYTINLSLLLLPFITFVFLIDLSKRKNSFNKNLIKLIIVFLVIYLTTLLIYLFNEGEDFGFNKIILYCVVHILNSYLLIKVHNHVSFFCLVRYLCILASINSIISIFTFLSPSLNDLLSNIFAYSSELSRMERSIEIGRASGIGYGGASLSALYGGLLGVYILIRDFKKSMLSYDIPIICMLLAGMFVSGRTGFLVLSLCLVVVIYRTLRSLNIKATVNVFIIFLLFFMFFQVVFKQTESSTYFEKSFTRTFEMLLKYQKTNRLSTSSTDHIMNDFYFLPEKESEVYLGTGNFGRNKRLQRIRTDVAYIRIIFGVGVIGLLFYLIPYYYIFKKSLQTKQYKSAFILKIMIIIGLIINLKEFFYFGSPGFPFLIILFYVFYEWERHGSRRRLQ